MDDLKLHANHCEHQQQDPEAIHDFEENGSGYVLIDGSDLAWDTMSVDAQADHTLGTSKGKAHFMCLFSAPL